MSIAVPAATQFISKAHVRPEGLASPPWQCPVLEFQSPDPIELRGVVCDESEMPRASVCCDGQVVCPNQCTALLEVGSDLRIVQRGVLIQLKDLDVREERGERGGILRMPRRNLLRRRAVPPS